MEITDENYVEVAEQTILTLIGKRGDKRNAALVSKSQLRSLIAMAADIYHDVLDNQGDVLSEEVSSRIQYLKVRFVYEAGKDWRGRAFIEEARLLLVLSSVQGSKQRYILFYRYLEALVAYRSYYGGRDE